LSELLVTSYRVSVTTHSEVHIAGVPWPMYKVLALIVGVLVLVVVGVLTASSAPAVLTAAGAATAVWVLGSARR
jgi:hypothetical protein